MSADFVSLLAWTSHATMKVLHTLMELYAAFPVWRVANKSL